MSDDLPSAPRTVTEERWALWIPMGQDLVRDDTFRVQTWDSREAAGTNIGAGCVPIPVSVTLTYTVPEAL